MKKFLPLLIGVCVFPFALFCGCDTANDNLGDSFTKVYGIKIGIEYEETTVNAADNIYYLNTGSAYTLEISLIQGGGSSPAALNGIGVTFDIEGQEVALDYADDSYYGEEWRDPTYYIYSESDGITVIKAYSGAYSCSATIIWQTEDGKADEGAAYTAVDFTVGQLNLKADYNYTHGIITVINSADELASLRISEYITCGQLSDAACYTDEFFEEKALLLISVDSCSSDEDMSLYALAEMDGVIYPVIKAATPEAVSDDIFCILLSAEVDKNISGCTFGQIYAVNTLDSSRGTSHCPAFDGNII
ncbi:MAG: hypothetical protein LUD27_01150 [Clostridia bacterium]|nr:hypothetical protein [Clostridia bacterium]